LEGSKAKPNSAQREAARSSSKFVARMKNWPLGGVNRETDKVEWFTEVELSVAAAEVCSLEFYHSPKF
jgi:hypothetical protein